MNINYFYEIIIIVFAIFGLLVAMAVLGINLNPTYPPPKLLQEVTIETFTKMNENTEIPQLELLQEVKDMKLFPIDSFCETHLGKAGDLNESCLRLTKDDCLETNCCVYTSFNKCVAGSKDGPTFVKNKEGIDYYYYQNKLFQRK